MRAIQALGASFLLVVGASACTTTVSTGTVGGGSCAVDTSLTCPGSSGVATPYSCPNGDSPEQSNGALECSSGSSLGGGAVGFCCVDVTFQGNTCQSDTSLNCQYPSIGFSCQGSAAPDQTDTSLICSTPGSGSSGSTSTYCCSTASVGTVTGCSASTAVPCTTSGATGYLCAGGQTPDASLNCGSGVSEPGGYTGYCCGTGGTTTPSQCAATTAFNCGSGMSAYACPGGSAAPAGLNCGSGQNEPDGTTGYCCSTGTTGVTACAADTNVNCQGGGTGYSCPSGQTPQAPLTCGTGVAESNGDMGFCCTQGTTTTSTCSANSAITCTGGTGYTCTGSDTPSQANRQLLCEGRTGSNGAQGYCCLTSGNSCVQAPTITDCPASSFGITCSGADAATSANAQLVCTGDPGNAAGGFCCASTSL